MSLYTRKDFKKKKLSAFKHMIEFVKWKRDIKNN